MIKVRELINRSTMYSYLLATSVAIIVLLVILGVTFVYKIGNKDRVIVTEYGKFKRILDSGYHLRPSSSENEEVIPKSATINDVPASQAFTADGQSLWVKTSVIWIFDESKVEPGDTRFFLPVLTTLHFSIYTTIKELISGYVASKQSELGSVIDETILTKKVNEKLPNFIKLYAVTVDRIDYGPGTENIIGEVLRYKLLTKEVSERPETLKIIETLNKKIIIEPRQELYNSEKNK